MSISANSFRGKSKSMSLSFNLPLSSSSAGSRLAMLPQDEFRTVGIRSEYSTPVTVTSSSSEALLSHDGPKSKSIENFLPVG